MNKENRITLDPTTELKLNEIFVFGSNEAGLHGAGAAHTAVKWGAKMGVGVGISGKTYAIPSKDFNISTLPVSVISEYVETFIRFVKLYPHFIFKVTDIGCGLAGHKEEDIAPLFEELINYDNVHFSEKFWNVLLNNRKMITKSNANEARSEKDIAAMKNAAAFHYGNFLNALGFDYKADPQTIDTPSRVAKAWLDDLIVGSVSNEPKVTTFPNEEHFDGLVIQTGIPVVSLCAHHNLPFTGYATVAYVPGEKVVGLSKLNRIVDFFARRPQMQESLTQQIHQFITDKLECDSVAVSIASKHMCCGLRGIKHPTSTMCTNKFSGVFMEKDNLIREEFLHAITKNGYNL